MKESHREDLASYAGPESCEGIREGAQAAVSMDSLPGQTLDGVITEISPAAQNQQGVVTYPIRIQIQVPDGVQLREGLSATAGVILREQRDVLLVPQQAVYGSFDGSSFERGSPRLILVGRKPGPPRDR